MTEFVAYRPDGTEWYRVTADEMRKWGDTRRKIQAGLEESRKQWAAAERQRKYAAYCRENLYEQAVRRGLNPDKTFEEFFNDQ